MRHWVIVLIVLSPCAVAEPRGFRGGISLTHDYHFQGIDQNRDRMELSGEIGWRANNNVSAGAWFGEFRLPFYDESTAEIDYFVRYDKQLAFGHHIDTSLWQYTYLDADYHRYNWTQWLTNYHLDERFIFTLGLSRNLFFSDEITTFAEVTAHHNFGPITAGLSMAANDLPGSPLASFQYIQLKAVYAAGRWQFFGDYTATLGVTDPTTRRLAHEGLSVGLSRNF